MKAQLRKAISILVIAAFVLAGVLYLREQLWPSADPPATTVQTQPDETPQPAQSDERTVDKGGAYTSKEEVALYLHLYGELPANFITKQKAEDRGWDSAKGNLDEVCPGMSIGGSRFGNYEGQLPEAAGRTWKECDINYDGGYRGAERILYSNDGLIYYTGDHYETFEQLY